MDQHDDEYESLKWVQVQKKNFHEVV